MYRNPQAGTRGPPSSPTRRGSSTKAPPRAIAVTRCRSPRRRRC